MSAAHPDEERVPEPGCVIAGIPDRIVAAFLDLLVLGVLFVVMAILFGNTYKQTVDDGTTHNTTSGVTLKGWALVLFLVLCLAYYFALESRHGQTLGKRAIKLRVVDLDGEKPSTKAVLLRTLGRILDVLPLLYLIGLIAVGLSDRRQRIGDRIARTTVARAAQQPH